MDDAEARRLTERVRAYAAEHVPAPSRERVVLAASGGGRVTMRAIAMADDSLARLRSLCLAPPETTERLSHGEPTWFVRGKKTFVMYANHHHDERRAFWCAAAPGAQDVLVRSRAEAFFVPPYVGYRGWLGVWLDVPVDWDEIADLVIEAYRTVAPMRLVARLGAVD